MRARPTITLLLVSLAACELRDTPEPTRFEGEAMGTTWVVLVADPVSESERLIVERSVEDELKNVDRKMSNYREDSELSTFNRLPADTPLRVSSATFEVFREAMRVSELTGGAFDVTVGPLVRAWGFGPGARAEPTPPGPEELDALHERLGFRNVVLDDDAQTLTKTAPGLECDLSGIAKGYAVDRVAAALEARGYRNYMVEVGGEVRTLGKNAAGEAWRIAIESPIVGARAVHRVLPLSGLSVATSGDYRNFYEVDGEVYSHLIDPRTERPVGHTLASVSVVGESCMRADALASGLLVLGPDEGYRLATEEDLAVLFLVRGAGDAIEERATPAFAQLFLDVSKLEP
jgi:thiamine biosynthesis lipoprotein